MSNRADSKGDDSKKGGGGDSKGGGGSKAECKSGGGVVEEVASSINAREDIVDSSGRSLDRTNDYFSGDLNSFSSRIDKKNGKKFLEKEGWPEGLQDTLLEGAEEVPIRFFICDNSMSMGDEDGHILVNNSKYISCSRWKELTETLKFHINLSYESNLVSEFRLLNGYAPILVSKDISPESKDKLIDRLGDEGCMGDTPLCWHIKEVIRRIDSIKDKLKANKQKACVIIATDGEASDGKFEDELGPLEQLQKEKLVYLVIRLCTDSQRTVAYWDNIVTTMAKDKKSENSYLDVLDDLKSEADQVNKKNKWITYGLPTHHFREFGGSMINRHRHFGRLDKESIAIDQIPVLLRLILGGASGVDYDSILSDFSSFKRSLSDKLSNEKLIWDPVTMKLHKPIKLDELIKKVRNAQGNSNQRSCSVS